MPSAIHHTSHGVLTVAPELNSFVANHLLPGLALSPEIFWETLANLVAVFGARNRTLLLHRDHLQRQLDEWYRLHREAGFFPGDYRKFLEQIGYLVADPGAFKVSPENVDPEIAFLAGPQLVVPASNARYALNAANARWGSLYDALYGTNAIPTETQDGVQAGYNRARGARVVAAAKSFLDRAAPLVSGSYCEVSNYAIVGGKLLVRLANGETTTLAAAGAELVGWTGDPLKPASLLLRHHGLHVELRFDRDHPVGKEDPAGLSDIVLESALTTIQDFEDSVAAVDAADKALVYANWLGLMRGDLSASFTKKGRTITRRLNPDRHYLSSGGGELRLPGRSRMLVRNVGLHLMTDMVLNRAGEPVPEGLVDAVVTCACGLHDFARLPEMRNSPAGSIYVVKPKLHGPDEVALTCEIFSRIEPAFGLPKNTVKIGIMDEERRTTVNLAACLQAARERVIFINTGFLDRTGDEIHTSMEAGPMVRKSAMKQQRWIAAYENRNVDVGIAHGLRGRGQIGKGMWAAPDQMAQMLEAKTAHPAAGASTAWVPSPTAATLHAMHYHEIDVARRQAEIAGRPPASVDDILLLPLLGAEPLSAGEIQRELENNLQGILGYVVRWIDQGIGCSKVPDLDEVGLMEDRATLRISSQHVANWLRHGLCSREQVLATLERMAGVVDRQNVSDPLYRPMLPQLAGNLAYQTARDLIFLGTEQPNGYTEFILHAKRRAAKARTA